VALTRVQFRNAFLSAGSVTPAATFTTPPTAGNLLVCIIGANENAGDVTITTPPAGYTQLGTDSPKSLSSGVVEFYFYKIAGAGEPSAVSATLSAARAWVTTLIEYADSLGGVWTLDQQASNALSSTTAPSSGTTPTTTQAAEVWVAGLLNKNNDIPSSPTNAFTAIIQSRTNTSAGGTELGFGVYEKIVAAVGTAGVAATLATNKDAVGIIATFYASPPPPTVTVAPAVTGTAAEGSTLTSTTGTWANSPTEYNYQWRRDNAGGGVYANIAGATSPTYTLTGSDVACRVRCVVTAINPNGATAGNSNTVGPVTATNAPAVTTAPAVTGVGVATLTTDNGTWAGAPTSYTRKWQRSANGTTGWADIAGATSVTYTLTGADQGSYVRSLITATNTIGSTSGGSNVIGPITPVGVHINVAMAFGAGPGTDASSLTWTDISAYVRSVNWQRGRQNELNQMQAGTGGLILRDPKSHFDPRNSASPFWPNVRPSTPVRATLSVGYLTRPLFVMYTERQPRTERVTNVYTERQIDLVDGFAILANAGVSGNTFPTQSSDARINAVLDAVGWSAGARRISAGVSTLQAVTYADDAGVSAQAHLLQVNDSENGLFFCDGSGDAVFVGRHDLIQQAGYTTSLATFRDAPGSSGYVCTNLQPSFDVDQVFNKWVGTREGGGVPQVAEDMASQAQYFLREKQLTSLVSTDAEVLNQVQWKLGVFSQPLDRVESITVMPLRDLTDTAQMDAALAREVGDRITVLETPPGFTGEQADEYVIQHLAGTLEPGSATRPKLSLTFLLWPAATVSFWIVGDPIQGRAGISTRPGY
jgi:hypothetical protein